MMFTLVGIWDAMIAVSTSADGLHAVVAPNCNSGTRDPQAEGGVGDREGA